MYKIPDTTKKFTIENASDVKGNIWYTKNINFSEEGYIKLSARAVSLQSEKDDTDFDIPLSFGRTATGSFLGVTADTPWVINMDSSFGLTVQQDTDTGVTAGTFDSWGRWWQNRWYQSTDTGLYYKSGSTWTNTGMTSTTTGKVHPIEVFGNKQTLCVGNGNSVRQINTSHATSTLAQLTIPADYEVIGLSYSKNQMAVATKLSDTAVEQNQEAMLFIWDGNSSEASAGYACGSDQILSIIPYKSSWVIKTRSGRNLYFNGGGFEELSRYPFFSSDLSLGDSRNRIDHGDSMQVTGDLLYLNTSNNLNSFGNKEEVYIENNPAGVWCHDPRVGTYQRYSPSISKLSTGSVLTGGVNTTTGIITLTAGSVPPTGNQVMQLYNLQDKIGGIAPSMIYYVIRATTTQFKLATTRQNAIDGQFITLTAQAAGTSYFAFLDHVDYGLTLCQNRIGGIGLVSKSTRLYENLVFGGEYEDFAASAVYAHVNATVPLFENRGYFVTTKMQSPNIKDTIQKVWIKYRPLKIGDKIILKYKDKEYLGLPVTTPQVSSICTWTSTTTFTTQADFSEAKTNFDAGVELECEVTNGAGAGSIEKITNITFASTTYTITLENEVFGVLSTNVCNVIINNWKYLGDITSTDTEGVKEFPIANNSKFLLLKCELRGYNTTVEELQVINDVFIPSK